MKHFILITPTAMAVAVASAGDEHQHTNAHSPAFERLKSLVGTWQGKDETGNPVIVSYRIVSDSSALMETLTIVFRDANQFTQQWTARMKGELMKPVAFEYARGK